MFKFKQFVSVAALTATVALGLASQEANACGAFLWTRYVAVLSNGQQMAVPNANSIPNAFQRARGCRSDVVSVSQFSQLTGYCLDYSPIVCKL